MRGEGYCFDGCVDEARCAEDGVTVVLIEEVAGELIGCVEMKYTIILECGERQRTDPCFEELWVHAAGNLIENSMPELMMHSMKITSGNGESKSG